MTVPSNMPKADFTLNHADGRQSKSWYIDADGLTAIERIVAEHMRLRAENERLREALRYTMDQMVWFYDDDDTLLVGQVYAWNCEYCIIDTPHDRYTVQHEHVFLTPKETTDD